MTRKYRCHCCKETIDRDSDEIRVGTAPVKAKNGKVVQTYVAFCNSDCVTNYYSDEIMDYDDLKDWIG